MTSQTKVAGVESVRQRRHCTVCRHDITDQLISKAGSSVEARLRITFFIIGLLVRVTIMKCLWLSAMLTGQCSNLPLWLLPGAPAAVNCYFTCVRRAFFNTLSPCDVRPILGFALIVSSYFHRDVVLRILDPSWRSPCLQPVRAQQPS